MHIEKIIKKMKNQPHGIRFEEAVKVLEYYMGLPYNRVVQEIHDENGDYFYGKILELDGCQSTGESMEELLYNLSEAMEGYIEVKLAQGIEIPEPMAKEPLGKTIMLSPNQHAMAK